MSPGIELGFPARESGLGFSDLLAKLRNRDSRDGAVSYRDRLAALDRLGSQLVARRSEIPAVLANTGVAFLAAFLQASNLESYVKRELPNPAALERFIDLGDRKSLRILPRGLVCHWIAGNVPLLGMFSWALSALLGNANALRLSSRQADTMSPLLELLADSSPAGRRIADETLVCFFDRDLRTAHEQLSDSADVRIAWGGREAIEAVRALPCRWECDDIVMGPRVSLAVVAPELSSLSTATRLATDVVFFDQAACSSPQVVFVRGAPGEPQFDRFVNDFAQGLQDQSRKIIRHALDFGETYRIELDRTRVLMSGGELRRDAATRWTMALLEKPLPHVACTNCFVQVVPVSDWKQVLAFLPENIQTIVTLLPADELDEFSESAAARGVCRFPVPGAGNHFDVPWDGIPLVSRLTRWVLRTDPAAAPQG